MIVDLPLQFLFFIPSYILLSSLSLLHLQAVPSMVFPDFLSFFFFLIFIALVMYRDEWATS